MVRRFARLGRSTSEPVALLVATLVAYYPAWHGGVLWDDNAHLTRPELQSTTGLWRIWFDVGATQQYYPLTHSTFWLMHRVWGDTTIGYHLVNIVLHATSAWLLTIILRRLAVPGAFLAAVIFALHPVAVESVAWMTELKNTLSGVCYLAAALAYLRFDARREGRAYAASFVFFVLALLAKTVTAVLPAAAARGVLVEAWTHRRAARRASTGAVLRHWRCGWCRYRLVRAHSRARGFEFQASAIERMLIAGQAICFYLAKLIWPASLMFIYPR